MIYGLGKFDLLPKLGAHCPNLERTSVLGFFLILGSDIGRPAGHVLLYRNRRERRQVVERRREVEKRELNESSPTQPNSSACLRMIYHQGLMELSRLVQNTGNKISSGL